MRAALEVFIIGTLCGIASVLVSHRARLLAAQLAARLIWVAMRLGLSLEDRS